MILQSKVEISSLIWYKFINQFFFMFIKFFFINETILSLSILFFVKSTLKGLFVLNDKKN